MIDISVMDRYGINLSAARVLKVIDHLVAASRKRGIRDQRGIPYCYASKEWIAGKIGKSVRTIARAIRDLKAAGLIECKRTRSNAMLFITGYVSEGAPEPEPEPVRQPEPEVQPCAETKRESTPSFAPEKANSGTSGDGKVTSCNDDNVTSNIRTKSINIAHNPSIDLIPCAGETGRDRSAHLGQRAGEGRASACLDEGERRRYFDALKRQMIETGAGDYELIGQYVTVAKYIADAVASKQNIRVNGVTLTADQYWDVVRYVDGGHLSKTIQAIAARDCLAMIKNRRAYLLSSVYNCALWDRFSDAAQDGDVLRIGGYGA